MRNKYTRLLLVLSILVSLAAIGCSGRRTAVERFEDRQSGLVREKTDYREAEFNFSVALYEPSIDDLEALRAAWVEYGGAFPESAPFLQVEEAVRRSSQKTVLVALFTSAFENADLVDKKQGWALFPVPGEIRELSAGDLVVRRLMPVQNDWMRYFLVTYPLDTWSAAQEFVVSNPFGKASFRLQ